MDGEGEHSRGGHQQGVPLRTDNEGAHSRGGQGVPLRIDNEGEHSRGGHPQGVPLRMDNEGGRTVGEGTHKGGPQARPPKGEERVKRGEERENTLAGLTQGR